MSFPDANIKVIQEDNCPFYKKGDRFELSGKALSPPHSKPTCLILAGDILAVLIKYESMDSNIRSIFDCSGCTGVIRFEYKRKKERIIPSPLSRHDNYIGAVVNLLHSFSIFENLSENEIRDIVSFLKLDKFGKDQIIIRKGEPGKKLFIIMSGKVEVLSDEGMSIAVLGRGEVFGEMSLLSGDPVNATVKVVEPAKVLYLDGEYFRKMLNRFSPLQIYLARLLARRLAKTNAAKFETLSSGMVGRLSDISPSGLFQTLNLNQKTGLLMLTLPDGPADLAFRDGEVIRAKYDEKTGREAFFELLKENDGHFKFSPGLPPDEMDTPEIGEFMGLLMEGVRRMDEHNAG